MTIADSRHDITVLVRHVHPPQPHIKHFPRHSYSLGAILHQRHVQGMDFVWPMTRQQPADRIHRLPYVVRNRFYYSVKSLVRILVKSLAQKDKVGVSSAVLSSTTSVEERMGMNTQRSLFHTPKSCLTSACPYTGALSCRCHQDETAQNTEIHLEGCSNISNSDNVVPLQ